MINWPKTNQLGIFDLNQCKLRSKIHVLCDGCGREKLITIRDKNRISNNDFEWYCPKCVSKREEIRAKLSESTRKSWNNKDYRDKITKSSNNQNKLTRSKLSESTRNNWKSGNYGGTIEAIKSRWQGDEYKERMYSHLETIRNSENHKEAVNRPEYKAIISERAKERWTDPEYRARMMEIRANHPRVSSIQRTLYSILEDLDIKHYREYENKPNDQETIIGPHEFDCVIPLENGELLIECQGDYWHSLDKSIATDKAKATYIERYHQNCEIKYLWEHEFKCADKIVEFVKYWTGKTQFEPINFNIEDVEIRTCPASDYKLLLSKYYYLQTAGVGGIAFGAYLDNRLIAVCIFNPTNEKDCDNSSRELSRICIHPGCQKDDFSSWFVSECIKLLNPKYKTIILYRDATFETTHEIHGFKLDGKLKPDYWYASDDGWVMHKKTLQNHAVKMGMEEKEYAELNGYKKTYGKEKLKFVYYR